ncbi:ROK family transcriptional regulator [Stakelama sp. CBK3Z-3]|uniref:ROK family transcriptional regulator n=1 Tax=Stakelama flava TaxID=2860338 RepID=A0ABS6XKP0_9SPHN|nr:ROK family transcriptional regulator [Stakelama flava]MBW4330782.1 ROK family transcriptional regulator [Stakelama flava]
MVVSLNAARKGKGRSDRTINVQRVLELLRAQGPISQADMARATALSRATVNNIIKMLRDRGVVEFHWKNGREALVALASNRGAVIVVKVEERCVRSSLFDFEGQMRFDLHNSEIACWAEEPSSPPMVLDMARRLMDASATHRAKVEGVAIAIEGPIERSTGAIAPWAWQRLPEWKGVDIQKQLARSLRVPLVVENDANLAALAEWTWGTGHGSEEFLHIICGSGVGGGLVLGGRIYRGGTGLAGEIGHMIIEETGELCFCGSRGCLTSFATEHAILAALRNSQHPRSSLREVVMSAQRGDAACQRVVFEAGQHIGKALATVVRILAPSVIAIGGPLALAGEPLLEGLRSAPEIINLRAVGESPRFCIAQVIEEAPRLGAVAAILARLDTGVSELSPWMLDPRPIPAEQTAKTA